MNSSPTADWLEWRAARVAAVRAVPGNLALVSYQAVTQDPAPLDNVPGATVRLGRERAGVEVTAGGNLGLAVDDRLVDGTTLVERTGPGGTPIIRAGRFSFDVFSLDGTDYELRVYDDRANNLSDFAGIECYDYDPAMAVRGRFSAYESTDRVAWEFTRAADSGHTKPVPGTVTIGIAEQEQELVAFLDGDDLVLVFADATSGRESYAPGRFLRIPAPRTGSDLLVDFNRAFVPPCGFSDFYSCPIPPPQNKLTVPVRAGEKRVTWKEPRH